MKEQFFATLLVLALCCSSFSITDGFKAKVVRVADGDQIEVLYNGEPRLIMLYGIDCPEIGRSTEEKDQPFAQMSRLLTYKLVGEKEVTIELMGKDEQGHSLAIVWLKEGSLNEELLRAGLAWRKAAADVHAEWEWTEEKARKEKKGLWSMPSPVAPWDWRTTKGNIN